ncbi:cobalt ECF transporter T component CbiQ [Oryzomonas sagensis]|uniref:Cobalt ECF transporter T component CbiQ n=1 Tax=Oryzomonas sagensis TaxID=2603857 RepID=A0ABQ6TPV1_9BACT|nr:cobalt ECF transporter T component CbiQ [Oryzomonas sagensis]KAB0671040.1 cobalt ECF transporter T component CbiQ [Oryzomonas sagensis]
MCSIDGTLLDFKNLDRLAAGDTGIHRLDPRAKVVVTLVFVVCVVSCGKYELAALLPFFLFPVFMVTLADIPALYLAKKIAVIIPFAVMVGMFNPLLDRQVVLHVGALGISGGWVSFASIVVRAVLTVSSALVLVAVTGFPAICAALERMGMPQPFAVQLLFLYRYIFVLTEEGAQVSRARELRTFGGRGRGIRVYGSMIGHLLLRTWMRAERIHMAMLARGFSGAFHTRRQFCFGIRETAFVLGWSLFFITARLVPVAHLLGSLVTGIL